MDNYRYYVNDIEVFPLNKDDLKYNYEKKSESASFFELKLETSLVFDYQSGNFNFKDQETNDKCEELNFLVRKKCSGSFSDFFNGIFSVTEGEFDDDSCKFTIKVRPKIFLIQDLEVNFLDDPEQVIEGGVTGVVASANGVQTTYANARYFENTILFVAQKSNPRINGIISNFFQINPDGVFYLPITNWWTKMVFCNLSDVQDPLPSNLSRIGIVTFKDLMDDLNVLFNVEWFIDSNYNLRIEHSTWFNGGSGLNLTQSKYDKYLLGSNKFSYDSNDYPKQETWSIVDHFQSITLTYGGIVDVGKSKNIKTYSTRLIRTDYLTRIYEGGSTPGLFLFATDGGSNFGYWYNLQGANVSLKLTPEFLFKNLHVYNRPSLYALCVSKTKNDYAEFSNSGGIVLESIKPTKKQKEISIPLCCDEDFDSKKQVLTDLGTGYVEKASFEAKNNMLKLELKYKVDNCSTFEPSDLDDLALWLKYNDLQKTGNFVDQWNDSSGNSRHATATGNARPIHITAVTPNVVQFSADLSDPTLQHYLTTPSFQLFPNKRGTIFLLMGRDNSFDGSIGEICVLSTNGGAGNLFDISIDTLNKFITVNESLFYGQNEHTPYPKGLFSFRRYTNVKIKTNQNSVPASNIAIIADVQPTSNPLIIGYNSFYPGNGRLNLIEVIIYDRDLTDYEVEKVELYLTKKGIYKVHPISP